MKSAMDDVGHGNLGLNIAGANLWLEGNPGANGIESSPPPSLHDSSNSGKRRRRRAAARSNGGGESSSGGSGGKGSGSGSDGHIDGKLVASLSWLNGAPPDEAGKPGKLAVTGRPQRNGESLPPKSNGQQILGVMNTSTSEVQAMTIGIRHHDGNALSWTNVVKPTNGPAKTWQTGTNLGTARRRYPSSGMVYPVHQPTGTTNNENKQAAAKVSSAQDLGRLEAAAQNDENNGPENLLFNYANEQNLNPLRGRAPETVAVVERPASSQRTVVESFDLHQETSDSGQLERQPAGSAADRAAGKLEPTEMDTLGAPDGEGAPHLARRSQGIDIEVEPSELSGPQTVHHVDGGQREYDDLRRGRRRQVGGNFDVGRLANGVIDGKRTTSRIEDDDDGYELNESSGPNEAPNEVNSLELNEPADLRRAAGLVKPSDGNERKDQTNSLAYSSSELSAAPDEFVTEKSNIQAEARQENRSKSNKSTIARAELLPMATGPVSERFGGADFINSSPGIRNCRKQLQLGPHAGQSGGASRRTRIGMRASNNDDARSIGGGGGSGPLSESGRDDGHKLLGPEEGLKERNRLSQCDKSALSHGLTRQRRHGRVRRQAEGRQFAAGISSGAPTSGGQRPDSDDRQFSRRLSKAEESGQVGGDELKQAAVRFTPMPSQTSPGTLEQVSESELPTRSALSVGRSRPASENDGGMARDTSGGSIRTTSSLSNTSTNQNDESLLWMASQYLYMHMRAFAASSLYGVQVDVEWSNENEELNWSDEKSNSKTDSGPQREAPNAVRDNAFSPSSAFVNRRARLTSKINQLAPIATIELVHGQDLHLQCTAQALGRLPRVDWYKRVDSVPGHISTLVRKRLARNVGLDTFWPVTSIGLLDPGSSKSGSWHTGSFASSQSLTIFDNLLNQTFTVVNSLALSQRSRENRPEESSASSSSSSLDSDGGRHQELYACLVTADVRHEFATLGVNIRHASSKMPPGLGKRLRARSMARALPANSLASAERTTRKEPDGIEVLSDRLRERPRYNHLRQHHLMMPYGGIWIPIRNNFTNRLEDRELNSWSRLVYSSDGNPITVTTLCLVIASMSSLLVALVYFTVRSYRILSEFNQDDAYSDCTDNLELTDRGVDVPRVGLKSGSMESNLCCNSDTMRSDSQQEGAVRVDLRSGWPLCSLDHSKTMIDIANRPDLSRRLYRAHSHDLNGHFECELLDDMIAPDIRERLECKFTNDLRNINRLSEPKSAVASSSYITWQDNSRSRVNMIANPSREL